jgi:hypothetical protein
MITGSRQSPLLQAGPVEPGAPGSALVSRPGSGVVFPLHSKKRPHFWGHDSKEAGFWRAKSGKAMQGTAPHAERLKEKCQKQCEEGEDHWLVKPLFLAGLKCTCAAKRRCPSICSGWSEPNESKIWVLWLNSYGWRIPSPDLWEGRKNAQSCTFTARQYFGVKERMERLRPRLVEA